MPDIALVTGRVMAKAEHENHLLVDALRAHNVSVDVLPWGAGTDWSALALVVVRTPWDYFEHRDEFLAWAADVDAVTQLVNPVDVLRWNSHKGYLLELAAAGIPVVQTALLRQGAGVDEQRAALSMPGEVVIKPAVSVGAIGASRADAGSRQAAASLAASLVAGDVLVQPLEEAVLVEGEASLVYLGGAFSHAVRKIPAAGDYRVQDHYGGIVVPHRASEAEREVAAAGLAAAGEHWRTPGWILCLREPLVMELELIEPELFLHDEPLAAGRLADHLLDVLAGA